MHINFHYPNCTSLQQQLIHIFLDLINVISFSKKKKKKEIPLSGGERKDKEDEDPPSRVEPLGASVHVIEEDLH